MGGQQQCVVMCFFAVEVTMCAVCDGLLDSLASVVGRLAAVCVQLLHSTCTRRRRAACRPPYTADVFHNKSCSKDIAT